MPKGTPANKDFERDRSLAKYDDIVKRLGRLRPQDLVSWLCPNLKVQKVSFEDREFELTHRHIDILYKAETNKGEFYIHLEFQVQLTEDFAIRLHEYSTRIYREFKLPVKTIAVFLESSSSIEALKPIHRCEFAGDLISEFHYTKVILPDEYWKDILKKEIPALLALIPLTKIPKGEEQDALKMASHSIEKISDKQLRAELAAIFFLIGGYIHPKTVKQVIGEKLMQDLMESSTYREAVELGEKMAKKKDILKALQIKMGNISQEIKDNLSMVSLVEDLEALFEKALTVKTLKEFEKALAEISKKK